jgi:hypothetical protein
VVNLGIFANFEQPQANLKYNYFNSDFKARFEEFNCSGEKLKPLTFGTNPLTVAQDLVKVIESKTKEGKLIEVNQAKSYLGELNEKASKLPIIQLNIFNRRIKKTVKLTSYRFKCDIIGCPFTTNSAQALGGHTSKAHKNQSKKFTEKQLKRQRRAPKREANTSVKQAFYESLGYDYIALLKSKDDKSKLREIKAVHIKKFRNFTRRFKRMDKL